MQIAPKKIKIAKRPKNLDRMKAHIKDEHKRMNKKEPKGLSKLEGVDDHSSHGMYN